MSTTRITRRLVVAVAMLLACGGGDLVLPAEGDPAAVDVVHGAGQTGRVGAALADAIVARVTDSQGRAVVDVPVAFAFTQDGTDATVAPDTAFTDADGRASFQVVAGTRVGGSSAEVRVATAGGRTTLAATVTFTAVSADANALMALAGDGQSAPAGAVLPEPLVVQVTDAFGNPIAGVPIAWSADAGGSVSQESTPTGQDGLASVGRTLGPSTGTQHTVASAPGLAGSPVTFTHVAGTGPAAVLERVSGDGQSTLVGTSVPDPLVVRARDGGGNPVAGLAVTWVTGDGGGSLSPQTSITDADGLASTLWTVGGSAGLNTATAVISGVGTVGFTATATAGTPPGISIETQPPATAVRGVALSPRPTVQLREPDGSPRPLAGVLVNVSVLEGGATLRGALARTSGADGRVEFADLALQGPPGSYTLAFAASGYAGTTSRPIALARAGTATAILSDDPDPSVAGAAVVVRFRVQSTGGTPSGTVRVSSDDGTACSAAIAAGECTLAPTAVGSRTLTASYAGDAEFEGSSGTAAHRVDAPPQPVLALLTQPSATVALGAALPRQPVVQLRDAGGNDLRTAGVLVTAALASGGGDLAGTVTQTTGTDGRASFSDLSIGGATGRHTLQFTAPGYAPVTSEAIAVQTPAPTSTTTTITADDPDPSDIGQAVTVRFTVAAAPGAPAGTVTGTVTVSASGGPESCSASATDGACTLGLTVPGQRTLTATYAGDGDFAGSAGSAAHTVRAAPPPPVVPSASTSTIEVKDAEIALGRRTDVIVTVRDAGGAELEDIGVFLTATGTGNTITPASVNTNKKGEARFSFSSTDAGTKTFTAVAGGVTLAQQPTVTVAPAATTTRITSDGDDPSAPGASIDVRFTVTSDAGTPSGDVTVTSSGGGSCTGTVVQGSCNLLLVAPGAVTLTASYAGGGNFVGSAGTALHTVEVPASPVLAIVTQPSASATSSAAFARQPELQLRSADGGSIGQPGVSIAAELASGSGSLSGALTATTGGDGHAAFGDLGISGAPGTYTIRFTAVGFTPITSAPVELVRASTITDILSDDPDPSDVDQPVTVRFSVSSDAGVPTGSVTVTTDGDESCTASVADGACSITLTAAGNRTLTASYSGADAFDASARTVSHTVNTPDAPPVGVGDAFTGTEDQVLLMPGPGVLSNDSDPDGDRIQATLAGGPSHGQVALAPDGGFSYTAAPDFSGEDAFTYSVGDGMLSSAPVSVRVSVEPVNDPPSFVTGSDQTASASAGEQRVPGWATQISPGPGDESGQTVSFAVEVVAGADLFAAAPIVAPDGTLIFTPSGTAGTAQVSVTARDDGGTARGGSDTSAARVFTIALEASAPGV